MIAQVAQVVFVLVLLVVLQLLVLLPLLLALHDPLHFWHPIDHPLQMMGHWIATNPSNVP